MNPSLISLALCRHCQGIVFDDELQDCAIARTKGASTWQQQDIYPKFPLLSLSATKGCSFCNYLLFLLQEKLPSSFIKLLQRDAAPNEISVKLRSPGYILRSQIDYYTHEQLIQSDSYGKDGPYWLELIFSSPAWIDQQWISRAFLYQGENSPTLSSHLGISLRLPPPHVLNGPSITAIKSWLHNCITHHSRCRVSSTTKTLPTRLIDIGTSLNSTPRLILSKSESLSPSAPYIALSYCWGPPHQTIPQLTTTTSTITTRQDGIPLESMPLTFQDLILFARHLGSIRYIWIDALCIVQDDPEDWEREAATMFSVYRDAVLTVVAGKGGSCHSGFLVRNSQPAGSVAEIPFQSRISPEVKGSFRLSHLNDRRVWDADEPAHMRQEIWASRGWTLQEDVMSTRVVYFTGETAYWRCQTERRGEHSEGVYGSGNGIGWVGMFSGPGEGHAGKDEMKREKDAIYARWRVLIGQYSERKLTVAADKFPAVSGLAKSFADALGGTDAYLAGLWKFDLVRQLLWETAHDSCKPKEWRAPTWSWAAWDGLVDWRSQLVPGVVRKCVFDEIHVASLGGDPFGRVKDGWIVMSAGLKQVKLRPCDTDSDTDTSVEVQDERGRALADGWVDGMTCSGIKMDGTWKRPDFGILDRLDTQDVAAAPLALGRVPMGWDDETGETQFSEPVYPTGLLLTKTGETDGGAPAYQRIGVFWAQSLERAKEWERDLHVLFKLV
ncbi:HET domain-containing protein [Cladorrhinum sp. PSN332]|nr:HET domain-containing protein [Cladorrhinum sp. PSN332]